ncbi:hypothetical protein [Desulfuromonas thiophila]|uniref:hypothetical protein n=1 Tax=Desulfuromonas thiophila TaxID=57664 RepID=UPI0029F4E898|nr:hypothetical protein [Desulfuromonas thiophila]
MCEIVLSSQENDLLFEMKKNIEEAFSKKIINIGIGVAEMVVGGGLIAYSVNSGLVTFGSGLVATTANSWNVESVFGAGLGAGIGGVAGIILGGIGIAGAGSAIGVPAAIVAGGAAAILAAFGYVGGDVLHNINSFLNPFATNHISAITSGTISAFSVGLALLVDGARRVVGSETFCDVLSYFKEGIIYLKKSFCNLLLESQEAFEAYKMELFSRPKGLTDTLFSGGSVVMGGAAGIAFGSGVAASMAAPATILGSQTLGTWAVSAGLIAAPAAPLFPVVLCGAVGVMACYAGWKLLKTSLNRDFLESINHSIDNDIIALPYIESIEKENCEQLKEKYVSLMNGEDNVNDLIEKKKIEIQVINNKISNISTVLSIASEERKTPDQIFEELRSLLKKKDIELNELRSVRDFIL